ncbi:cytochrome-c oxidase, cbb3-type subunit III [Rhizobium sp. SEMIA 4085]|uniref:Cbb3-type cytochrome c oxidase subunit n=1 Tax=Rhizobium gallicum bv. gallicum R602sp TaxID=1041138 RepID=A0A0B4X7R8_9HYPH|nr:MULTISPECIES: cytochrome-c oxidase, cbb3-type subunit III [Rhizobium]AJD42517.1 cbb3-type cytochrome-c oxidase subunit FixP 1 [Rhizobium gallicum bv. gallicum R602sp]NNH32603.1 cytochrome-c oxidase, cbb3-type subunit III [Rhizobium sp. SEMIA 4085]TDW20699.1 cytochrome c oxidase cbb3-type subunit 3 [Rhizobium azibense]
MEVSERDPVSGRETTGHEWNGIKELDTPVPRGVLIFLIVTHIWAIAWWFFVPAWPLGTTYTKGVFGIDQKTTVEAQVVEAQHARSGWMSRIGTEPYDAILADEALMETVRNTGRQLFGDNCAACHGRDGKGRANYPDLTDDDWLWGGGPQLIEQTMRVGINTRHPESRIGQMPAFGRDQMLDRSQVRNVAAYVYSLAHPDYSTPENVERIKAGREVFITTCAACHGEDAEGKRDVGAPNLTDSSWIYGGDLDTIVVSVHGGRQGHMPTWDERLTTAEIRTLALYVHDLGTQQP